MPIMPSDCADSERPIEEGRKLSCSIAAWTFFIASADTGPAPEMARDAVDMPTPASKATSFSVATKSPELGGGARSVRATGLTSILSWISL
jgi:hypothetical protein